MFDSLLQRTVGATNQSKKDQRKADGAKTEVEAKWTLNRNYNLFVTIQFKLGLYFFKWKKDEFVLILV